jgi:PAS domain S-box-containing protein
MDHSSFLHKASMLNGSNVNRSADFFSMISAAGHGIAITSPDFVIEEANNLFAGIFSVEPDQLKGKNFLEVLPENIAELIKSKVENEVPVKGCFSINLKTLNEKKRGQPVCIFANPVRDDSDQIKSWIIVAKDFIIEYEEAKCLYQTDEKYRELTESLPDIIFESDLNFKIVFVNKAGVRQFGYTKEETENDVTLFNLIPRYEWDKATKLATDLFVGNMIRPVEFNLIRKNGTVFIGEVYMNSIVDNACHVKGFRGIVRDLSYRKEIEDKNSLNAQILSSIKDAIIITDLQFRVTDCNTTAEEIVGINKQELMDRDVFGIIQVDAEFSGTQDDFIEILRKQGCIKTVLSYSMPHSANKWLELRISEVVGKQGSRVGWVFLASDITESKNRYCQYFCVNSFHDFAGSFGFVNLLSISCSDCFFCFLGFRFQPISIFTEINPRMLFRLASPPAISIGFVRRLNSLLSRSMGLVVLREVQRLSSKFR